MSYKMKLVLATAVFAVAVAMAVRGCAPAPEPVADAPKREPVFTAPPETPAEAEALPDAANFGYTPDHVEIEQYRNSLPFDNLRQTAPQLFTPPDPPRVMQAAPEEGAGPRGPPIGDPKYVVLYRPLLQVKPDWIVGKQGIGDCVSWGHAHAIDMLQGIRCANNGTKWIQAATEPIYGGGRCEASGRTFAGYSDGSYGAAAVKWLKNWGALFRVPYPTVDLTVYSASRAKEWGAYGNGGKNDGGVLDAKAKEHPVKSVSLVVSYDELKAAVRNGYPVTVCSGQGFRSQRDANGFAQPSGSWAHCMVFIGFRDDIPGALCLNSWGPKWIGGPKFPSDQPDGSFWVDARTVNRMLSGRDSWAISDIDGFVKRTLRNAEGW